MDVSEAIDKKGALHHFQDNSLSVFVIESSIFYNLWDDTLCHCGEYARQDSFFILLPSDVQDLLSGMSCEKLRVLTKPFSPRELIARVFAALKT